MKWTSITLIAAVVLVVVYYSTQVQFNGQQAGIRTTNLQPFDMGETIRLDEVNPYYVRERKNYWELLPFRPAYWPLASLVFAIFLMWATRNLVDKFRFWTRAVLLGLLFAPLPIPSGAHVPIGGIYPAALGLVGGLILAISAMPSPMALVGVGIALPCLFTFIIATVLFRLALKSFDDGNPLPTRKYFLAFCITLFINGLVYFGGPVLYKKMGIWMARSVTHPSVELTEPRKPRGAPVIVSGQGSISQPQVEQKPVVGTKPDSVDTEAERSIGRRKLRPFVESSEKAYLQAPPQPKVVIARPARAPTVQVRDQEPAKSETEPKDE